MQYAIIRNVRGAFLHFVVAFLSARLPCWLAACLDVRCGHVLMYAMHGETETDLKAEHHSGSTQGEMHTHTHIHTRASAGARAMK